MVNTKHRKAKEDDPEFMPFPKGDRRSEGTSDEDHPPKDNPLANKALVLQFVKSPLAVNPGMVSCSTPIFYVEASHARIHLVLRQSKQEHIYLQGEDRLYLNLGQTREFSEGGGESFHGAGGKPTVSTGDHMMTMMRGNISLSLMSSGSKHWTSITIPHTYMGNSWPIRVSILTTSDCHDG